MTDDFYLAVELYKRNMYDLIAFTDKDTKQPFRLHNKQVQAVELLNDVYTTFVGYGGAARGGKSALICLDSILSAHAYPKTVNLIGRKKLTLLWETTWQTYLRMLYNFGFVKGVDYTYHENRHELTFHESQSMVLLKNLELKPSDKEGTEYGSLEIWKAYIDQSEHVPMKIIEKIHERVGTHYTCAEYGLKGKVFESFNPSPNHTKRRYWIPFKNNQEKETVKFVRSLPSDNPGQEAKRWLKEKERDRKDGAMTLVEYNKQVKGDFDYDDDPTAMLNYEDIFNIWHNNHINLNHQDKCIICDVARYGSDEAIITVWYGLVIYEYHIFPISSTVRIQNCINAMRQKHGIPKTRALADEDGVGGGVVDNCGIIGYKNNGSPTDKAYNNIKDQCGYELVKWIKEIYFQAETSEDLKQDIEEQLQQLKTFQSEKDNKLRTLPKEKIKENIGKSPDWKDVFEMRMFFKLVNPTALANILKKAEMYI